MVTMSTATAPLNGDNSNPQGHYSQCGKIWVLNERHGGYSWCGKSANCQTLKMKPRRMKSSRRRNQRQENGNGYDQLPEPYLACYNVALPIANSVPDVYSLLSIILVASHMGQCFSNTPLRVCNLFCSFVVNVSPSID